MANDTRTEETPVTENQEEAMSTSEQTPTEPKGEAVADESQEAVSAETEEPVLPEGAKDRTTEQFDKLKEQLRDERVRREEAEAYASQSAYSTPQAVGQKPIYDPATGYVDTAELEALRVKAAKAEAGALKADKKFEKYIAQQQEKEAFAVYPELDSKSKDFDQKLANATRGLITDSIMNPKDYGGELSLKDAADQLKGLSAKDLKQVAKATATKVVEELTPKEQASLEATGRSDRRNEVEVDYSSLRNATRRGSKEATIARLRSLSASD